MASAGCGDEEGEEGEEGEEEDRPEVEVRSRVMQVRIGLLAFVVILFGGTGCRKLGDLTGEATTDASTQPKEVRFGLVKLMVAGDTKVEDSDGILTLLRPNPRDRMKQERLQMSAESMQQYQSRTSNKGAARVSLPRGEMSYRVDKMMRDSEDATLFGELKIEPDAYFYVTCNVNAVDAKPGSIEDWCLPVLRTVAHQ
jgi:hypothetical protein